MTGVLAVMVGLSAEYRAPALLSDPAFLTTITGSGTATPSARSSANSFYAYADRIISGKVYWEIVTTCGLPVFGIAQSTTSVGDYGGYAGGPKGVAVDYSHSGEIRVDGVAVGTDPDLTRAVGKRFGIAVDVVAKTMAFYQGGVLQTSVSIDTAPLRAGPLYAHLGGQMGFAMPGETCGDGSTAAQFCFGPSGCAFAPPSGYSHL